MDGGISSTMNSMPQGTHALVRGVPRTYDRCIRPAGSDGPIDLALAREQHREYCLALRSAGLGLIEIEPDDRFPDCCFVEDTAILVGEKAIITRMGAESRRGEEVEVERCLALHREIHRIEEPGCIDGGDVLVIDDNVFVGIGERTDKEAVLQLRRILGSSGYRIIPVPLTGVLHLKSACTYVGNGHLLLLRGCFDDTVLREFAAVPVPHGEAYAANCLSVNGKVLVSKGYPATRIAIEGQGFETIEIEMSEFRKGQGSLTCLSKII
jgi:dimethylargininase